MGSNILPGGNDLFTERPDYQRPASPNDRQPTTVTSVAADTGGTTFEQAMAALSHAQNEFQEHVRNLEAARRFYSDEGFRQQIDNFIDTPTFRSIDEHVDRVKARRDQAQGAADTVRGSLIQPGDAAQESRNTRFWNRTKPKLDVTTGAEAFQVAEKLIAAATPEELSVLLEELPSYFEVKVSNLPTREQTRLIADLGRALDTRIQQASPQYGRAVRELAKANQAVIMIEHNARRLKESIGNRSFLTVPLSRPNRPGDYDPDKP